MVAIFVKMDSSGDNLIRLNDPPKSIRQTLGSDDGLDDDDDV